MNNQQVEIDPLIVIDELTKEVANKTRELAVVKAQLIQLTKELNDLRTLEIK